MSNWKSEAFALGKLLADKNGVFYFKDAAKFANEIMKRLGRHGKTPENTLSKAYTDLERDKYIERARVPDTGEVDRKQGGKIKILREYISTSRYHGERNTSAALAKLNITHVTQFSFKDLIRVKRLYFDFCVRTCDFFEAKYGRKLTPVELEVHNPKRIRYILIEFDGVQHRRVVNFFGGVEGFEKTQVSDRLKEAYVQKHNYALIRLTRLGRELEDLICEFNRIFTD